MGGKNILTIMRIKYKILFFYPQIGGMLIYVLIYFLKREKNFELL